MPTSLRGAESLGSMQAVLSVLAAARQLSLDVQIISYEKVVAPTTLDQVE
jgi:hypothetical protein